MRFNVLNRKIHYWATPIIALPLIVIIASGLLLQIKKQWTFVQPPEQRGAGATPQIELSGILSSLISSPETKVNDWGDIDRIDIRPKKGVAKVLLKSGYEVQVDLTDGRILQTAYRRSDLIESLHDGSFFGGDIIKLGLFLPSALGLLLMWFTGLWMFWVPFSVKRKKKLAKSS
jgi:uncharacterized iron-regulated membrane protein